MPTEPNVIFYPDPEPQHQRKYVEVVGQLPDPKFPFKRERMPLDAFGMDSPWDDQVKLYQGRKFLQTPPVIPPITKREQTPLEAFRMDSPWDDFATLYQHRKFLDTSIVVPPDTYPPRLVRPQVQLIEWDPWEPILAQPHRRYPAIQAPFVPHHRQPLVELLVWEEVDVVQFRGRRFLLVPVPPFIDHGPSMIGALQEPMMARPQAGLIAALDTPMTAREQPAMIAAVDEPMIAKPRP